MKLLFERMKLVVEPSGCVPLAAILEYPEKFKSIKTGVVLSGGNIDPSTLHSLNA
jgi:threonine dehydratase